jgi:hypothetical protein
VSTILSQIRAQNQSTMVVAGGKLVATTDERTSD